LIPSRDLFSPAPNRISLVNFSLRFPERPKFSSSLKKMSVCGPFSTFPLSEPLFSGAGSRLVICGNSLLALRLDPVWGNDGEHLLSFFLSPDPVVVLKSVVRTLFSLSFFFPLQRSDFRVTSCSYFIGSSPETVLER